MKQKEYYQGIDQPKTATVWPTSERILSTGTSILNQSPPLDPTGMRSTFRQFSLSTRPRRSPIETVQNDQVIYSAMIPNNYSSIAHSASYFPQPLILLGNYEN